MTERPFDYSEHSWRMMYVRAGHNCVECRRVIDNNGACYGATRNGKHFRICTSCMSGLSDAKIVAPSPSTISRMKQASCPDVTVDYEFEARESERLYPDSGHSQTEHMMNLGVWRTQPIPPSFAGGEPTTVPVGRRGRSRTRLGP